MNMNILHAIDNLLKNSLVGGFDGLVRLFVCTKCYIGSFIFSNTQETRMPCINKVDGQHSADQAR